MYEQWHDHTRTQAAAVSWIHLDKELLISQEYIAGAKKKKSRVEDFPLPHFPSLDFKAVDIVSVRPSAQISTSACSESNDCSEQEE